MLFMNYLGILSMGGVVYLLLGALMEWKMAIMTGCYEVVYIFFSCDFVKFIIGERKHYNTRCAK